MKDDWSKNQIKRFRLYVTASVAMVGLAAGGCTMTDPGASPTADAPSEMPDETLEMPAMRFPSIRLSRRSTVPIDSLMANREDDEVAVSGLVTQRAAILEGWLYEVRDDTGSLWVLSDRSEPTVGAIATVEGIVRYESIVVGEIDAGSVYLEEQAYEEETDQQEPN